MTIQVVSNDTPATEAQAPAAKVEQEQTQSAPEGSKETPEQNESSESDTEETDAKEESEDEESSETEADEAQGKEDESQKDKPKKKGGFQRRIEKLIRERQEERRAREALEARLAQLESGQKPQEKADVTQAEPKGEPQPEDFDTHREYVKALTKWELDQREKAKQEDERKSSLKTEQEKTLQAHQERVKAFAEKTEDFEEVLDNVDDVPMSASVEQILISSENGPELMYELAKNREEFERICKLPPLAAAREIGKLETRLTSIASEAKKPEPKKITKAPKPPEPVGKGSSGVTKSIYDPDITQAEYERLRREQIKRRQA